METTLEINIYERKHKTGTREIKYTLFTSLLVVLNLLYKKPYRFIENSIILKKLKYKRLSFLFLFVLVDCIIN